MKKYWLVSLTGLLLLGLFGCESATDPVSTSAPASTDADPNGITINVTINTYDGGPTPNPYTVYWHVCTNPYMYPPGIGSLIDYWHDPENDFVTVYYEYSGAHWTAWHAGQDLATDPPSPYAAITNWATVYAPNNYRKDNVAPVTLTFGPNED